MFTVVHLPFFNLRSFFKCKSKGVWIIRGKQLIAIFCPSPAITRIWLWFFFSQNAVVTISGYRLKNIYFKSLCKMFIHTYVLVFVTSFYFHDNCVPFLHLLTPYFIFKTLIYTAVGLYDTQILHGCFSLSS